MSRYRMRMALAVANIPKDEFERLVESENPPTITQLAEIGRRATPRKPRRRLTRCPHCGGDLSGGEP